jgi:hypothetical protein
MLLPLLSDSSLPRTKRAKIGGNRGNSVFQTGAPVRKSFIDANLPTFLPVRDVGSFWVISVRRSIMWAVFLGGYPNGNGRFNPPGGCVVAKKPP